MPLIRKPLRARADVGKKKAAGLIFGINHFTKRLQQGQYAKRINQEAGIFMAAALEYLVAEIIELSGNAAKENKKGRITPQFLQLAIRNDDEIEQLIGKATLPQGGVLPQIHSILLSTREQHKKAAARAASSMGSTANTPKYRSTLSGKTPMKAPGKSATSGIAKPSKGKVAKLSKNVGEEQESAPA